MSTIAFSVLFTLGALFVFGYGFAAGAFWMALRRGDDEASGLRAAAAIVREYEPENNALYRERLAQFFEQRANEL